MSENRQKEDSIHMGGMAVASTEFRGLGGVKNHAGGRVLVQVLGTLWLEEGMDMRRAVRGSSNPTRSLFPHSFRR